MAVGIGVDVGLGTGVGVGLAVGWGVGVGDGWGVEVGAGSGTSLPHPTTTISRSAQSMIFVILDMTDRPIIDQ